MCEYKATTLGGLSGHRKSEHDHKAVTCSFCSRICQNKMKLWYHVKSVHNQGTCDICLVTVQSLKKHMKNVHTSDKDKKFHCEQCEKGFPESSRLSRHMMNEHIKSRPYHCRHPPCEMRYNDLSNRNSHERKSH